MLAYWSGVLKAVYLNCEQRSHHLRRGSHGDGLCSKLIKISTTQLMTFTVSQHEPLDPHLRKMEFEMGLGKIYMKSIFYVKWNVYLC